jgi:hypothetical protein
MPGKFLRSDGRIRRAVRLTVPISSFTGLRKRRPIPGKCIKTIRC